MTTFTPIPAALSGIKPENLERALAMVRQPHPMAERSVEYAGGDDYFAAWLLFLDARFLRSIGLSLFDLADTTLRDFYDDGITPAEAYGLVKEGDDLFGF